MAMPGTPSGVNHSADSQKCGRNVRPRAASSSLSAAMRGSSQLPSIVRRQVRQTHVEQRLVGHVGPGHRPAGRSRRAAGASAREVSAGVKTTSIADRAGLAGRTPTGAHGVRMPPGPAPLCMLEDIGNTTRTRISAGGADIAAGACGRASPVGDKAENAVVGRLGRGARPDLAAPRAAAARPRADAHQHAWPGSSCPTLSKYVHRRRHRQGRSAAAAQAGLGGRPARRSCRRSRRSRCRRSWASPRRRPSPTCGGASKSTSCGCRCATSTRRRPAC